MYIKKYLLIVSIIFFTPVKAYDEVVFVSSYSENIEAKRGMFDVLIKDFKLDFKKHIFYLNSKGKVADIIDQESIPVLETIKEINPSIVFLADDSALKCLGPGLVKEGIKVIALGINGNPRAYFSREDFHNVYGVLERPLFLRGVIEINSFVGYKENAIILFDDSESAKIVIQNIFKDRPSISFSNTNIKYAIVKSLTDIEKVLESIDKNNTHLFLGPVHSIQISEQRTELLSFHEVLHWLTDHYKASYYSFWKDYITVNGATVSYGVDLSEHATIALDMAYKILNNTVPRPRFITLDRGQFFQLEE